MAHFATGKGCASRTRRLAAYTFLSDGWWTLIRPSSSHLTSASSSFTCRTVPNSPVGIPKSPKPSTRSPGLKSRPAPAGSTSAGFLARSESGGAPRCDNGGWASSTQSGCRLIALAIHIHALLSESPNLSFASTVQPLDTEWAWRECLADPNCSVLMIGTRVASDYAVLDLRGQLCRAESNRGEQH